jgi:hypothetical protein
MPDNRHLSTGIHPITTWHNNSSTRICIIAMITLILDKHALVKVGFPMKDLVHQRPGWSTPHQEARPGGFTPLGKGRQK